MIKKILTVGLFILALGLAGRMDMQSEIATHKQDELNKQAVIQDLTNKCIDGSIDIEYCTQVEWD